MICLICQKAETFEGLTSVTLERDEFRSVVNDVPARVCPRCGEAYLEEEVTVHLLRVAKELSEAGMSDEPYQYPAT
ncbi:MAG: YgiT-type zinc finger protein [Anaerolineales bacterium]|nr:YgiT-type zinc finger protein [Anaerolineales bacterium]